MGKKISYKNGGVKVKQIATYVLTVSKTFPQYHPRFGQATGFKEKINNNEKLHTIRGNYKWWKKRIDKINKGEAVLSVRQWTGKPYRSTQVEIARYNKLEYHKIDIEILLSNHHGKLVSIKVDKKPLVFTTKSCPLINNDGFDNQSDFINWFGQSLENGIIIHFTDLKY